jgi:hypothetical protein
MTVRLIPRTPGSVDCAKAGRCVGCEAWGRPSKEVWRQKEEGAPGDGNVSGDGMREAGLTGITGR